MRLQAKSNCAEVVFAYIEKFVHSLWAEDILDLSRNWRVEFKHQLEYFFDVTSKLQHSFEGWLQLAIRRLDIKLFCYC